jgi:isopropylmalate/homocitrate/citramalate synthase
MAIDGRDIADKNQEPLWMVSPFKREAQLDSNFPPRVRIADCTLRDGQQQPGVVFTPREKVEIAKRLDALGVYEIEGGTPAVHPDDREALVSIVESVSTAKVSALALARNSDVDLVKECGAWGVRISLPIGYVQRSSKLKLDDKAYLQKAIEITTYAREQGLYVIFSPYDTTRCDLRFLQKVLGELQRRGTVDRIRLVDTVGCATPDVIKYLVNEARRATDTPLEIHCHNDFGLAVANTIAGAKAGVEYLSVTMNGIGERSGNASLEETAVALLVLYDVDVGLDTRKLTELSHFIQEASRVRLQHHKPIVGENSFTHEAGTVVAGVLRQAFTAEPYAPHLVGQKRRIALGKKSGAGSVDLKLSQLGYAANAAQRAELLKRVKDEAVKSKAVITDAKFDELAHAVLALSSLAADEARSNAADDA